MKRYVAITVFSFGMLATKFVFAQKPVVVPAAVKAACAKKYPDAKKVNWETEKGNFEANWGGKSGEDNSALFSPVGDFLEIARAIHTDQLPATVKEYLKKNYKNKTVTEAAVVTDASGKVSYEAEVSHKDLVFDENGRFKKTEKE